MFCVLGPSYFPFFSISKKNTVSLRSLQYHLVCHDQLAQHPVPLRPTTPDPAMLCCQGDQTPLTPPLFSSQSLAVWQGCTNLLFVFRGQGGITEGLVKGALYVATSAYKALFTGPNCSIQVGEWRLSSQKKKNHSIHLHLISESH